MSKGRWQLHWLKGKSQFTVSQVTADASGVTKELKTVRTLVGPDYATLGTFLLDVGRVPLVRTVALDALAELCGFGIL